MTGNDEDRLEIRKLTWQAGIRRRNMTGGETELRHQVSHENQNSIFFVPNNQGATRLSLSYRQSLLNASGQAYNESRVILARIQANSSEDESCRCPSGSSDRSYSGVLDSLSISRGSHAAGEAACIDICDSATARSAPECGCSPTSDLSCSCGRCKGTDCYPAGCGTRS